MIIDFGSKNTVLSIGNATKLVATAIAIDELTSEVVAYGEKADAIRDRAQSRVSVIQPVVRGTVTDLEAAKRFLRLVWSSLGKWEQIRGGRVRILTSTQLSRLDRNVLAEALSEAKSGRPEFVWKCLACAVQAGRDIDEPEAIAVVDLGAETTEIAIFSARRLLRSEMTPLGGSDLTRQIQRGASTAFGVDIAWSDAEDLKHQIGTALPSAREASVTLSARDRISGLPTQIQISQQDIETWLRPSLSQLRTTLRDAFSGLKPQVASDVYHGKVILTGGGALLSGMEQFVSQAIGVDAVMLDEPIISGVLGARTLNLKERTVKS